MKLADALNLHNEDEVMVKKTKEILNVVETEVTPGECTTNNTTCVDVLLSDGRWYGYKELS